MSRHDSPRPESPLVDEYDNIHFLSDKLARGGQGVVFRTKDADLAIKQPLDSLGNPDKASNLRERFNSIRLLPLPSRIPISLPLASLRDEPGYVMRLLNGMKPFEAFEMNGTMQKRLNEELMNGSLKCPEWLAGIPDPKFRLRLLHYSKTGSTRRRLIALSRCASILARLHSFGLVYGDISPKNVFVGEGESPDVWLIDVDNLRLEMSNHGSSVYTPHYGAPEIVQGLDQARPRTDCWAFSVLAFQFLALIHPFIGRRVLESGDEEGGWDADPPSAGGIPADLDEQAYAGLLPFIDDDSDDSNAAVLGSGLPRELVITPGIRRLFQEAFVNGRKLPHRRPSMGFWALELAKAFDQSLLCPCCEMSYFVDDHSCCPYCGEPRPAFFRAITPIWRLTIPSQVRKFSLPHRLFHPFSFEHAYDGEYEATLDYGKGSAEPLRGTNPFPPELSIEFIEVAK